MKLVIVKVPLSAFLPAPGVSSDVFQMTLSWRRMTKRLAKLALLPGPRAWSLRLVTYISKASNRGNSQRHGCLSPSTTGPATEPTTSPFDRPISPSIALFHDRVKQAIRGGDREAAVSVHLSHVTTVTPPLPEQSQDQGSLALNKEKWKIVRIVGKRRGERVINTRYIERRYGCSNAS